MGSSDQQPGLEQQVVEGLDVMSTVPKLGGPVGRAIGWLDRLFTCLATLALVGIAGAVLLQIAGRLFLPFSPAWTEELSRYLFIYMVALSAGVVIRKNRHVNVELFHHWLGPRARAGYQVLVCLLVGGFALIVLPYAWQYAQNGVWQTSPTLKVSMLYIFFSTVVLFALVLVYSAIGFIEGLVAMWRGSPQADTETPSWK
ncbi:TRAP transporter small permease [Litchfieldella rifensis]|uniref:TRAP transporter small permease protein n=1 Tax=Litchfieldella rifensis TaxID=762643 RepID=A0ABV7LP45_9GAMM